MLAVLSMGQRPRIRIELPDEKLAGEQLKDVGPWSGIAIEIDMAQRKDFMTLQEILPRLKEICLAGKKTEQER